jgi:hypothetical protein
MISELKAEKLFRRMQKSCSPSSTEGVAICAGGRDYCASKATLEDAWDKCEDGGFLYTWLYWFCNVHPDDITFALGYPGRHYGPHEDGRSPLKVAHDLRDKFTYLGGRK